MTPSHTRRLAELAHRWDGAPRREYAYVLGMYLGDGHISRNRRTYRLRITLGTAYPLIINECIDSIAALMPDNAVSLVTRPGRCVDVSCYSMLWPDLLPQHGPGLKHRRRIALERWQQLVVEAEAKSFVRGLYHSDGSYFQNPVRAPSGKRYSYDRYTFSNESREIRDLFSWACGLIGVEARPVGARYVSVARRASVARLNEFLGPKA